MVTRGRFGGLMQQLVTALACCALVLLLSVAAPTSAEYTAKDDVVILTDKNFEKEVLKSGDYWLVEFYAPWYVRRDIHQHSARISQRVRWLAEQRNVAGAGTARTSSRSTRRRPRSSRSRCELT